jgi:acyl-CoA thioesterase II
MNSPLNALLALKRVSDSSFESIEHRENFRKTLFGGQVLAQALMAACQDIDRNPHSLHAYFLRAGSSAEPVLYEVENVRDGRSISNRRVVALQAGRPIFHLSCSFHVHEPGFEHQEAFPDLPSPEQALENWQQQEDRHVAPHDQDNQAANPFDIVPVGENLFFRAKRNLQKVIFGLRRESRWESKRQCTLARSRSHLISVYLPVPFCHMKRPCLMKISLPLASIMRCGFITKKFAQTSGYCAKSSAHGQVRHEVLAWVEYLIAAVLLLPRPPRKA